MLRSWPSAVLAIAFVLPALNAGVGAQTPDESRSASLTTIFGLRLGEPLSIAECPRHRLSNGSFSELTYDPDPHQICYEPDIQLRDAPWRRGGFNFPIDRIPLIMQGHYGFTIIIDGRLEGVEIDTLDHTNTDAIIGELTQKYGPPTSVERDREDIGGVPVPDVVATWRRRSVTVEYRSVDQSLDHGALRVMTPRYENLRVAHEREANAVRAPL